jgi:hypothetical protein
MSEQFQHLLDAYGADVARWPAQQRADAERLLATDPAARALWERARQLDARIARQVATVSEHEAQAEQAAQARVLAALAQLPAQRKRTWWGEWSSALLDWDFTPAWPRIAALASVAVVGFAIGLAEFDDPSTEGVRSFAQADTDVSSIVFEPETLTGLRP